MADIKEKNPYQDAIDRLAVRILPRVRAMPFAVNSREPWLGNTTVDKAVIATIEACFAIADEDKAALQEVSSNRKPYIAPTVIDLPPHELEAFDTASEETVVEKPLPSDS